MNERRFAALAAGAVLLVVGATAFLLSGCTGGASRARQQERPQQSNEVALPLQPNNGSKVRGTATFRRVHNGGVVVKVELHSLPKPNAFYLAHIHPGTCAQGEQEEEEGPGEHGGAAAGKEIEWPLSPIRSGTRSDGSSTPRLRSCSPDTLNT